MEEPLSFIQFWKAFPRKESRKRALEWWIKHKPSSNEVTEIARGMKQWKTSEQWTKGIVPHAATWLNGEMWKDDPIQAVQATQGYSLDNMAEIELANIRRLGI